MFYLAVLRAVRSFKVAQNDYIRSMERIPTGLRINRAADDPAGLAISEKMRGQIRGLNGISLLNVADGALHETHAILQRLREIAVYSATGTLTDQDRHALQIEFEELVKAIDDIGANTQFNTIRFLDGSTGANAGQNTEISLGDMQGNGLGLYDENGSQQMILSLT